ncbi:MAG: cytochrome c oxidase subunit II [Mesorhizobium sp.]|uniref:cytochrome c oxidase subunit II n=1 Tax=Mesorhizobium sp. TaxID=1871066 RepID=UPI0012052CD7|nr:cytochrome c oxidase subunit II [Mesorhizobium sp.]TIQ36167.1 MAG: cytochrome c oxidase subunit II [Mesorhizobium sp.]
MESWPPDEIRNFRAGKCPRRSLHLWRVDAAKQKNAANQTKGKQRRDIKPGLAENPGVTFETHRSASFALDEANNTQQHRRVPDAVASPLLERERIGTLLPGLAVILVGSAFLPGCAGVQSALDPHGEQADTLAFLFWTFTAVLGLVWLVTMAGLLFALTRPRGGRDEPAEAHPAVKRPMLAAFAAMLASSAIVLCGLTVLSFGGQRVIFESAALGSPTISVTGHQWWWQVRYEGDDGFETANEIRIPVGSPVDIKLATADVIHSFWIPSLAGKLDLIPGKVNELQIEASKPGIYRGQCAEFCGQQHAHMAIFVVAMEPNEFERWRTNQAAPAKLAARLARQGVVASARSPALAALPERSQ